MKCRGAIIFAPLPERFLIRETSDHCEKRDYFEHNHQDHDRNDKGYCRGKQGLQRLKINTLTFSCCFFSVRTPRPTTGPPLPRFELSTEPLDMLAPRLCLLDRFDPTDPLIAGEGSDVFPSLEYDGLGGQRFSQVGWNRVDCSG